MTAYYVCTEMNKRLQLYVTVYLVKMHYVFLAE